MHLHLWWYELPYWGHWLWHWRHSKNVFFYCSLKFFVYVWMNSFNKQLAVSIQFGKTMVLISDKNLTIICRKTKQFEFKSELEKASLFGLWIKICLEIRTIYRENGVVLIANKNMSWNQYNLCAKISSFNSE